MPKNIILTCIALLGFTFCSSAQIGLRIGLNVGPTFSRAGTSIDSLPEGFEIKTKIGYSVGLQIHYGFSDVVGVETGIQYVSKGYSLKNDTNSISDRLVSTINDIEIPLSFTLRQQLNSYSFVREKVGVSLGIHTQSNEFVNISAGDNANLGVTEEYIKKLYPMFNLGIEYGYLTDNGNAMLFGINYSQGLGGSVGLNFHNNNTFDANLFDLNYRASDLVIRFAYLFSLSNIGSSDEYYFE
jgi:hypothetical protein